MMRWLTSWLLGVLALVWRASCKKKVEADPRPKLRAAGQPYVYALLHAHQVAGLFTNDEDRAVAMVSRSRDGELMVPALRLTGVVPIRGSGRGRSNQDKGGGEALAQAAQWVTRGVPALLTVDGPRGPKGRVHSGIVHLARQTHAVILPVMAESSTYWLLPKTWDQMRLPKPFSRCTLRFGRPIKVGAGEDTEQVRARLELHLNLLETTSWPPHRAAIQ